MTDATIPGSKPAWTRCPSCKTRVFNDKIDVAIHRGFCPADFQRRQQEFERRIKLLEAKIDKLDEQVSAEPAIDLDDVAPWEDDPSVEDEGIDDPVNGDQVSVGSAANYYNDVEDEYPPALPR